MIKLGSKVNKLTVIELTEKTKYKCLCECGKECFKWSSGLNSGKSYSCGCESRKTFSKLSRLLDESLQSYYWLGFLMADGHFSKGNRLKVALSVKDRDHLEKFAKYVGVGIIHERLSKSNYGDSLYVEWQVMDSLTIAKLKEKFSIKGNKTETAPILTSLTGNFKKAFAIGFADGDGSILFQTGRKDCLLRVKCHSNWLDNLKFIYDVPVKINKQGYAEFTIADNEVLRDYKRFALENSLPVLDRKWDKVNIELESRYLGTKKRVDNILHLKSLGMRNMDIAMQLDLSDACISTTLKRIRYG